MPITISGNKIITRGSHSNNKILLKNGKVYMSKLETSINSEDLGGITYSELDILCRLNHPNIIHAEGLLFDRFGVILPMGQVVTKSDFSSNPFKYLRSLLLALNYLHENGILYLDLHIGRLVEIDGEIVLTGFTLSKQDKYSSNDGELYPFTSPPEQEVSYVTDVWSIGILILRYFDSTVESLESQTLKLLTQVLLNPDHTKRPTCRQLLGSRFFNEYPKISIYVPDVYDVSPEDSIIGQLKDLERYVKETIPNEDVEILFLSLDIYYRYAGWEGGKDVDTDVMLTCVNMALATITSRVLTTSEYQLQVLSRLNGSINTNVLYRNAETLNDLNELYKIFFENPLELSHFVSKEDLVIEKPRITIEEFLTNIS